MAGVSSRPSAPAAGLETPGWAIPYGKEFWRVLGNLVSFASAPVLQPITFSQGAATLSWRSEAGLTYRVQFKSELGAANWINLEPLVTATNSEAALLDSNVGQAPHRFYRVLRLP